MESEKILIHLNRENYCLLEARNCFEFDSKKTISSQKDDSQIKDRKTGLGCSITSIKQQATVSSKLLVSLQFYAYTWKLYHLETWMDT
ncbi:hypothetical protein T4D_14550 [Trichinella pseudospiralis]|uniref:Uncharacterized protein n=1 Tax=Trichinella pseudospiralis TaxID=6337 RepID=A0A0V1FC30_TRIPS|nr:hypothetical protein T4D_14550 [Trichinella pseudospiralis]